MGDQSVSFDPTNFITLYVGDTDADPATGWLTQLQQRLVDKGFDPGPVDGVVGNQTWGLVHDAFGVAGGTNRARPHRGGGSCGGSGDSRTFSFEAKFAGEESKAIAHE